MAEDIKWEEIEQLTSKNKKMLKINDRFLCQLCVPNNLEDNETYYCWSEQYSDNNSPRLCTQCDLYAYDTEKFRKVFARLVRSLDPDLDNKVSYMLYVRDPKLKPAHQFKANDAGWVLFTVQSIEVNDDIYPFKKFLKLLKHKPIHIPEEPFDSLGFSIAEFAMVDTKYGSIEYTADGLLYYEILDCHDYKDGEFIPLDSERREDVISYVKLTDENVESLAKQIDQSLDRIGLNA